VKRAFFFLMFIPVLCFGQGFGFEDDAGEQGGATLPFNIRGKIEAGPTMFINDFKGGDGAEPVLVSDIIKANTGFEINGKNAQAFLGFNLSYASFSEFKDNDFSLYLPRLIDEAWLKGYFGKFTVQAGIIKLRWGRMYTPGPLDVVNPLDYSNLTNLTESRDMKIARPLIHASFGFGEFSSVEAVFLPSFAPHRFAQNGRWVPSEYSKITDGVLNLFKANPALAPLLPFIPDITDRISSNVTAFPQTSSIDYFQTGMRFNTVIGSSDLGFQYFYGNYMRPSVIFSLSSVNDFIVDLVGSINPGPPPTITPNYSLIKYNVEYSRYHQIGVDYSQVLLGFTVRAEFAAHITNDLSGSDGKVKNPFLAWAFGFDRDIFAEININVQLNENIRLLNDKVGNNPETDCEAGTNVTSTRLMLMISKNFFRDKLECKVVNIWDIESSGFAVIPSVAWILNDLRIEMTAGFFAGAANSELGQYRDNSFLKLKMIYSF